MMVMVRKILSSQYLRPIIQLTTGSIIAQLITILVAPLLTRLYTPEQLGIYTLIITIIAMFGPIMCGKYESVIVSAKDEKEAIELIVGSAFFSIIFLALITVGYKFYLLEYPEITEEVGAFAYLLIGLLTIASLTNILSSYNNRHKEYKTISSVYVIRTAVQNVGLIIFGLFKLGTLGLLLSQFIGSLLGLKKQGEHLYREKYLFKKTRFKEIIKVLIKYRKQPLYSMPAHFVNSSSYSLLNFFISGLFGMGTFGYYSMSYRILGLPLSLISTNVSKVFFQRASEEKLKTGEYSKTLRQITLFLTCISIPMALILAFLGPYMFELVFGDGWYISGVFVRILAPMYGFRFIVSALTPALIISNKQGLELIVQSLFIVCSVGSYLATMIYDLDIYFFLTLITITYSIIYILLYIIIYKLSKKSI